VFEHPALYDLADVLDGANRAPEPGDAHHAPMTASGLSADELAAVTRSWSVSRDGAR
jgi:mycobactin peptide synthetase MbtE